MPHLRLRPTALAACFLALGRPGIADGQTTAGQSSPISATSGQSATPGSAGQASTSNPFADLLSRNNLLGDLFGVRSYLAAKGITYGINETSEVLGNVTGGVHQGADYDGLTLLSIGLDTDQAFGWLGGTFNVSALEIHGRSLSADNLDDIQTASGIEADRTFRLWELWFDQANAAGDGDLKIGQQSIDQEFLTSTYSTLFLNTMLGWPAVPSYDLYAGGPAYPLSSLGIRLRGSVGPLTGLIGVYDDNPPGGPFDGDDQLRGAERTGAEFNLGTGALVFAEVQLAVNQPVPGQNVEPGAAPGLPGLYRVGGWVDSGAVPDQRLDDAGLSLADPVSDGNPALRRHDFGVYGSFDQEVWTDSAGVRSIGTFLRLIGAPDDRNFLSFSLDAGLDIKAPLTSRPNDAVGVAYGLAKPSQSVSELDHETRVFTADPAYPIRSSEGFVELTYQAQIAPWWQVQPDVQYVWTPGGGLPAPNCPGDLSTPRIGNEAILGLRTTIAF